MVDGTLWEIPLTVTLRFLGVPEEDMDRLRECSIAHTVNAWGRPSPERQAAVAEAVDKFWRDAAGSAAGRGLREHSEERDRWRRFHSRILAFRGDFSLFLSVVPLFVMMGVFTARAGLSRSLFNVINGFFGHVRGGPAVTAVGACALYGAICGSSLAVVATMGRVAIPKMKRHGYADILSSAAIAAGGTLGMLIPPPILLVIYGVLTQTSIGQLFIGAIVPGVLGAILYGIAIVVRVRAVPELAPSTPKVDWGVRLSTLRRVWGVAFLFALVVGGIYLGWFSPTEAAAVGAFGLTLSAKELNRERVAGAAWGTAGLTGMIFFILIGASLFNYVLETTGLPSGLIVLVQDSGLSPLAGADPDHAFLRHPWLLHGFHVPDPADHAIPGVGGAGVRLRYGVVRRTGGDGGRDRVDHAAGRHEPVRRAGHHAGTDQRTVARGILPFILAASPALTLWLPSKMF